MTRISSGRDKINGAALIVAVLCLLIVEGRSGASAAPNDPSSSSAPGPTLDALIDAYETRSFTEYRSLFREDFQFFFSPVAIKENPKLPESWGYPDEMDTTVRLFEDSDVDWIQLSFQQNDPEPAGDEIPGAIKIRIYDLHLEVQIRNENGEPLTLLVEGHPHVFYFVKTPADRPTDVQKLWRIVRWNDEYDGSAAVGDFTWGGIKALFR